MDIRTATSARPEHPASDIAIVGLHCRLPGANDVDQFWRNLRDGVDAMTPLSDEALRAAGVPEERLRDPQFVKVERRCERADWFDAAFFGLTPREAQITDPQVRVFLESAWELLERAGYDPQAYPGLIGVYAGMTHSGHEARLLAHPELAAWAGSAAIRIANDRGALATTTSYKLNLTGPSLTVQTACSTSLVAVHLACQALLEGDCDMALAGGVCIDASGSAGYRYEEGGILSPDGRCRAFDAEARGTAGGSGIALVLLKRLADAVADRDRIHAVIKGTALNNDGSSKVGYTAPSVSGQAAVIRAALEAADVEASSISYVEAHGTGTPLGDPVEVAALTEAFQASPATPMAPQSCAIGSVKSSVGHLDAAAGVTSLIKVVLALTHRQLPASLHYRSPNPSIDFAHSPFFVNGALRDWTGPRPLRAGVSAFGIGGTNAHVIVEEPPPHAARPEQAPGPHLLVWSARTPAALTAATQHLADHLRAHPALDRADAAYTLQVGRRPFAHRGMVVCDDATGIREEAIRIGRAPDEPTPVVWLFPGQGTQVVGMGRSLYEAEPRVRRVIDRCCDRLQPLVGLDLRTLLYADPQDAAAARARLADTAIAQPALFVTEYALAMLWREWGLTPAAMIGHSLGEYVAACVAGVMSETEALTVVAARGALMRQAAAGAMLAIETDEETIAASLSPELSVAAVNGARQCVVAGREADVVRFATELSARGVAHHRLTGNRAFHSALMDPILPAFREVLHRVSWQRPRLPFVSNVTGRWADAEAVDPEYWVRHARWCVRLADGIDTIAQRLPGCRWVETGPGHVLSRLTRQRIPEAITLAPMDQTSGAGLSPYLDTLGQLWLAGAAIDWTRHHQHTTPRRVTLPTYPFERQLYRLDVPATRERTRTSGGSPAKTDKADIADWFYVPTWKQAAGIDQRPAHALARQRWLVFASEDDVGEQLARRLRALAPEPAAVIVVRPGEAFGVVGDEAYRLRLDREDDYGALFAALRARDWTPDRVVHAWGTRERGDALSRSVLFTLRTAARATAGCREIDLIARGLHAIADTDPLDPDLAPLLGLCAVVPREYPDIRCRTIDLDGLQGLDALVAALRSHAAEQAIAIRGRRCWTRELTPVRLAQGASTPSRLRRHGVYLITGGLGRIGLEIASYLARTTGARLVLVGRSPAAAEIARAQALREQGAEILVMSADVADRDAMRTVVAETHHHFGAIHGVVHAAAEARRSAFAPLEASDAGIWAAQFQAKREGLRVLDELLREEPLDFCLLCSSLAVMVGGAGYGAYAAANAYMDAFAWQREQAGRPIWTSINWDGWTFNQAPARHDEAYALAMTPAEGIEALDRLLRIDPPVPQVIVSTTDLQTRLTRPAITAASSEAAPSESAPSEAASSKPDSTPAPFAADTPGDPFDTLVSDIWEQVLGRRPARASDDFFEIGGNSLAAIKVLSELRTRTRDEVALDVVFTHATAGALAGWLRARAAERTAIAGPVATVARPPLVARARPVPMPASFAQQRLWFIDRLQGGSTEYNLVDALRLRGSLDRQALARAMDTIVSRHESLRTRFDDVDGLPVQIVDPARPVMMTPEQATDATLREVWHEERQRPFDLARGPLIRIRLLQFATDDHVLVRTMHHIVSDAWSEGVFTRELTALYAAFRDDRPNPLPPLTVQYADFALWQRRWLESGVLDAGLAYWTRQLANLPDLLLPADHPRPSRQTFVAQRVQMRLPRAETTALKQLGQQQQATTYMSLLTAFAALLARYTGQDDIVIGSPIANRQDVALDQLIGYFVNSLVLRMRVAPEMPFATLLRDVRQTALDAYASQDVPFERLVEALAPPRRLNISPLFQVSFALQNTAWTPARLADLQVEPLVAEEHRISVDLDVYAFEQDGEIRCTWLYNADLFDRWRIEQMARHFLQLVGVVTADPTRVVRDIPLLDADDTRQLLARGRDATEPVPTVTLPAMLDAQARRTPDATAVVCGDRAISHGELHARSSQLARHLIARGVGPEVCVGVALDRSSPDLAIALLGVWKAGGVCLLLDPALPAARAAFMRQDAHVACVLTTSDLIAPAPAAAGAAVAPADDEMPARVGLAHAAYILYTSGSTGTPKGVIVSHAALVNKIATLNATWRITSATRLAVTSPVGFDPLFEQLCCPLIAGGTAILLPDRELNDRGLASCLTRDRVTHLDGTPALAAQLLEDTASLPRLDTLTIGGDVLPPALAQTLVARGVARRVWNVYGPTEACIDAAACDLAEVSLVEAVPIGGPLPNYRLYVVDDRLHLAPTGVAGELYIAGSGLARGYLRQPALTAARFVADPHGAAGTRMYRTGDRAHWRADGRLELLGRTDDQVKICGVRIELGEVEHVLRQCPGVAAAVAVCVAPDERPDDRRLLAYVVAEPGQLVEAAAIRRRCAEQLPEAFVPAAIVPIDRLPLTAHGKIDRRQLPVVSAESGSAGSGSAGSTRDRLRPPRTPDEAILCAVFAEVLGVERVGLDDDFFDLGGHSLLATRAASRIRAALDVDIAVRTLFEAPTVAELSARLRADADSRPRAPLAPMPRPVPLPASWAQQRLWFLDRLEGSSAHYHMPEALRLRGPLDLTALTHALETVVARHDTLRTCVIDADGLPMQEIVAAVPIALPCESLEGLDEPQQQARVQDLLRREWHEPFDLARAPLWRVRLLRLAADHHVLLLTLHHIISDGWSQGVLLRELFTRYANAAPLPPLPVQYADYTLWQQRRLDDGTLDDGLAYWTQQLAGIPDHITLPADHSRPAQPTFAAGLVSIDLASADLAALKRLGRQQDATLFMTLLATCGVLLSHYSGQDDVVIGTAIANRQEAALEDLIGFFVNALALRIRVAPHLPFASVLRATRQTTLDAYRHQDVPFERLVEALAPRRRSNRSPVFQVNFTMQEVQTDVAASARAAGLDVRPITAESLCVRYDLEVHAAEQHDGLRLAWLYDAAIFDRWRIEQLARHYVRMLQAVAATPEIPVHRICQLDADEQHTLLERFNAVR